MEIERLTKKTDAEARTTIGMPRAVACYWKLKKYEDIEEEIGIDLITKFNIEVSNQTVFVKQNGQIKEFAIDNYDAYGVYVSHYFDYDKEHKWLKAKELYLFYKDYKKTWSLVKKELEK